MLSKICDISEFQQVLQRSHEEPVVLFKHSTRCSISSVALARIETDPGFEKNVESYLVDVIACRPLSNLIAEHFNVQHESPQVLVIFQGECIFDESHLGISAKEIIEVANEARTGSQWRISPQ